MTIPLDSARAYAMVAVSRGVMVTPAHKQVIFGKFPMLTFYIVSGIVLYLIIVQTVCTVFNAIFEPAIPQNGRQYGYKYRVRSKVTKRVYPIWEPYNSIDEKRSAEPTLRAMLWPVFVPYWFYVIYVQEKLRESLENKVEQKRKQFQDEQELKRKTQDYLNGKGEL